MTRRLFPLWPSRPSLVSKWWEEVVATSSAGTPISNFTFLNQGIGIAANPLIVPHACRATRWSAMLTYGASGGGTPITNLDFRRGAGCVTQSAVSNFTFEAPNALGALNCASGRFDPSIELDRGDLWRIGNGTGGGVSPTITNLALRIFVLFEMR